VRTYNEWKSYLNYNQKEVLVIFRGYIKKKPKTKLKKKQKDLPQQTKKIIIKHKTKKIKPH